MIEQFFQIGENWIDKEQYAFQLGDAILFLCFLIFVLYFIQKFGKMPEFYFLYYEELDWCTQIQKTGSSIWFEPKAIIYHKESASVGIESPLRIYYHTRNRLIFAQRILSKKRIRICSYIYQTTFALCKKILIFTIQAKFHLIPFLFKGIKDGIYFINNNSK